MSIMLDEARLSVRRVTSSDNSELQRAISGPEVIHMPSKAEDEFNNAKDDGKLRPESRKSQLAEAEKTTESQSVFNMVNAIMGAGALGFPFCYKSCGLVLTTVLVLINLLASELSMRFLVTASHIAGRRTYEELACLTLGKLGQRLVDLCVVVLNMGSLIAYVNILADVWSSVSGTIIPPGAEPSRNFLMTVITLFGALPVALFVKSPQLLSSISQATVGFVLLFGLILMCFALLSLGDYSGIVLWRWEGFGVAFPVLVYGFTAHQVLFSIYSSMRAASMKRMNNVIQKSLLICCALYVIIGASGYVVFRQRTNGDLLRNLGGSNLGGLRGIYERALKLGYGISVLGTIPLVIIPFFTTCTPLVASMAREHTLRSLTVLQEQYITVAVLVIALVAAILLPNLEFIFGLTGSTASVLLAYVLPSTIFLKLTGRQRRAAGLDVDITVYHGYKTERRLAAVLLVFGCASGVLCTRTLLYAMRQEAQVVQLATQLAEKQAEAMKTAKLEEHAKRVAEAVSMVSEATKQLNTVQQQTSDTLHVVKKAAESLKSESGHAKSEGAAGWLMGHLGEMIAKHHHHKETQQDSLDDHLDSVKQHVGNTVSTLQDITTALQKTANKLRSDKNKGGSNTPSSFQTADKTNDINNQNNNNNKHATKQHTKDATKHQPHQTPPQEQPQITRQQPHQPAPPQLDTKASHKRVAEGSNLDARDSAHSSGDSAMAPTGSVLEAPLHNKAGSRVDASTESRVKEVAKELTEALRDPSSDEQETLIDEEVEHTAAALVDVASRANTTLSTVKQTVAVLEAVSEQQDKAELPGSELVAKVDSHPSRDYKKQKAKEAMEHVANATAEAATQLDETVAMLRMVQAGKTEKLETLVKHLAEGKPSPMTSLPEKTASQSEDAVDPQPDSSAGAVDIDERQQQLVGQKAGRHPIL